MCKVPLTSMKKPISKYHFVLVSSLKSLESICSSVTTELVCCVRSVLNYVSVRFYKLKYCSVRAKVNRDYF
jgi:hypothetical protein